MTSTSQKPFALHAESVTPLEKLLDQSLAEPLPRANAAGAGLVLGRIVACDNEGVLLVLPQVEKPQRAQSLCALNAADVGRTCAVLFAEGDPTRPLIMGCIMDSVNQSECAPEPMREVRVNGEKLILESDTELELRCGEAVILLQRNGVIEIRGNYVTSHATATQRIRGGSVHVN